MQLAPLMREAEALNLSHFYMEQARERAKQTGAVGTDAAFAPIILDYDIVRIFREKQREARDRAETGVRQREFLHALHIEAERVIQRANS